jgi:hypothetical protein
MATDNLNVHKRQCMQQREVPSILSFQESNRFALADVYVTPMMAYSLNRDGMFTSKIQGLTSI